MRLVTQVSQIYSTVWSGCENLQRNIEMRLKDVLAYSFEIEVCQSTNLKQGLSILCSIYPYCYFGLGSNPSFSLFFYVPGDLLPIGIRVVPCLPFPLAQLSLFQFSRCCINACMSPRIGMSHDFKSAYLILVRKNRCITAFQRSYKSAILAFMSLPIMPCAYTCS